MADKLIKASGIVKLFSGVMALSDVDFELDYGEVHALMGENGAGKSTLSKIITGIYSHDNGKVFLEGKEINFQNPKQAMESGISIVLQEFNLLPDLTVAENMFLTDDEFYNNKFFINKKKMANKARELLALFDMDEFIDPYSRVATLSVAQMQIIEILKAVSTNAKVIILDEPTAPLSPPEVDRLFKVVRQLKAKGVGFIIVSHRINEIYEISDRITVLRDGKLVLYGAKTSELDQNDLIKAMVGREVNDLYGKEKQSNKDFSANEVAIKVENICDAKNYVRNVSFEVRSGEIFGISGLVGAGRSELIRCIFGADKRSAGKVFVYGDEIPKNNLKASIAHKVAFVSEDRKNEGLLQQLSILKNSALSYLAAGNNVLIDSKGDERRCLEMVKKLNIKVSDIDNPVKSLSGGNQQKVLLAKWLLLEPKILIIDEPTRGIDIAAKSEIYAILKDLAARGIAVIMVSSEIPEILGICDRLIVMRDGQMIKEMSIEEANEEKIGYYSTIGAKEGA